MPDDPVYYSVLQYVPDPIADERMNVGVLVYQGDDVWVDFISSWRRASTFGGEKVEYVKEFANEIETKVQQPEFARLEGYRPLNEDRIRTIAETWNDSIQITSPRTSLSTPESLLESLSDRFLHKSESRDRGRDRRHARKIAYRSLLKTSIKNIGPNSKDFLHRSAPVNGRREPHTIDLSIGNGEPLAGAESFSFEVQQTPRLERDLESTMWKLNDIREGYDDLFLGMVVLPPVEPTDLYRRAQRLCESIDVELVDIEYINEWAEGVTQEIKGHLMESGGLEESGLAP